MIHLFTPVRQDPETLALVLKSHRALEGIAHRFYVDDNVDERSKQLLVEEAALDNVTVWSPPEVDAEGQVGHKWTEESIRRMEAIRNMTVTAAHGASSVFSVDSDVVLNPGTVFSLAASGLPVVSEVFWTKWPGSELALPQVWDFHPYGFGSADRIIRLKHPGEFKVNGLGACTLIDADLLRSMVNPYSEIPSLKRVLWGEDRWFCVRLNAMGVDLHASTFYPPFHVYRPAEQLDEARHWYEDGAHPGYFRKHWLTAKWEEAIRKMY